MKSQLIRNVSVALLAASWMFAQESQRMIAEIPFAFHVGSAMLPAGDYAVDTGGSAGIVKLRSTDAKSTAMVLTHGIRPATGRTQPKLIFNRYGNEHFLSQVWTTEGSGLALPKTKLEKEQEANARRGTESIMARK